MLSVFVRLWDIVSSAGSGAVNTEREKRELRLLNRGLLLLVIIQSCCLISHLSNQLYRSAFLTAIFVSGLVMVHLLIRINKTNVAKISAILVINWNSFFMAIFLGAHTHVADFLLISAIMPLYFFEIKTRKYIFWGIAVSLIPYAVFHYFANFLAEYALPISQQLEIYKTTVPVMVLSMSALLYLIYNKNAGYESDVNQKEQALIGQKRMYERILEQIPIDIVTFDKEMRYSYINASGNRSVEVRNAMLGKTNTEYFALKGWNQNEALQRELFLQEVLTKEETIQMEEKQTDHLGNTSYSLKSVSPIYDDNNDELLCLVGYSLDITEMKEAEKKLMEYSSKLEKKNSDMRNFVYATSHDLKTPLRNIASFLQLIERRNKEKLYEDSLSMISHTVKSVKHLNQLIQDINQYSVADNNDSCVVIADFNELLNESIAKLSAEISSKRAKIERPQLPHLEIVPEHIILLFTNLISNAIKFNASENPTVKVDYMVTDTEYVFSVSDNGIGIDDEYIDHIFGMFQRLHSADEYDGTGMGLAICNKIIEKYGRKIWVESKKGNGSTFYFSLAKEKVSPQYLLKDLMPDYAELAMAG